MANQINVSSVGGYVEREGSSILISSVGAYIELGSSALRVSSVGAYVEYTIPPKKFTLFYGPTEFEVMTFNVQFTVSSAQASTLVDTSVVKLPIIPDWVVTLTGAYSSTVALSVGDLSNQTGRSLYIQIRDRFNEYVTLTNSYTFVTGFTIGFNIDGIITYNLTIVGSGVLQTL